MDTATLILCLAGLVLLVAVVNAVKSAEPARALCDEAEGRPAARDDSELSMPIAALTAGPVPGRRPGADAGRKPAATGQERRQQARQTAAAAPAPAGMRITTVQYTEIIVFRRPR